MRLVRVLLALCLLTAGAAQAATGAATGSTLGEMPWWVWPLALFVVCFLMGIVAVPAGIGGGTLFVPIVGSFFPFHLDFVRGAGLLVALASALSAGPMLLRGGLGSLRLALPLAVLASASSIGGALLGLAMPANVVQMLLGGLVLGIVVLMFVSGKSEFPQVPKADALSQALQMHGVFVDRASGQTVQWQVHRTVPGLLVFLGIGVLAGMFGIGAGWANVPALKPADGRAAEGGSGQLQRGAVAGGLFCRLGLPEPGRRAADGGRAVGGGHDAGRAHRRPAAQRVAGLGDPQARDRHAAVCRRPCLVERNRRMAMNTPAPQQPPEQLRYATWLEWGTRVGLAVLVLSFLGYAIGLLPAQVTPQRLAELWGLPVSQYLQQSGAGTGWAWLAHWTKGDTLGLVGIVVLAGCSVPALLALLPLFWARGDKTYALLVLAEVAVVVLAASGVLTGGH